MEKTFEFPVGCSVRSVTLRETDGRDEDRALRQAEAKGSLSFYPNELMRCAIVKVDGKVPEGHVDIEAWNSRTRLLVKAAFNKMNSVEDTELAGFLKGVDAAP